MGSPCPPQPILRSSMAATSRCFPSSIQWRSRMAAPLRRGLLLPRRRCAGRARQDWPRPHCRSGRRGRRDAARPARRYRSDHHPSLRLLHGRTRTARRPTIACHARAATMVRALIISPERLRALLIAEAEIGERIMRALILRRVGLIEAGVGGPIIIGRADHGDVLRLESFLSRNRHPFQHLDPEVDPEAKTLIERFHLDASQLPIVLCPNGKFLRSPSEDELVRCLGLVRAIDPDRLYDLVVVGAGPAGLATAVYAGSEGLSVLVLDCRANWRPSRGLGANRELSRISGRDQRHGFDGQGLQPSPEIRRRDGHSR